MLTTVPLPCTDIAEGVITLGGKEIEHDGRSPCRQTSTHGVHHIVPRPEDACRQTVGHRRKGEGKCQQRYQSPAERTVGKGTCYAEQQGMGRKGEPRRQQQQNRPHHSCRIEGMVAAVGQLFAPAHILAHTAHATLGPHPVGQGAQQHIHQQRTGQERGEMADVPSDALAAHQRTDGRSRIYGSDNP